jgi:hypothetical protein
VIDTVVAPFGSRRSNVLLVLLAPLEWVTALTVLPQPDLLLVPEGRFRNVAPPLALSINPLNEPPEIVTLTVLPAAPDEGAEISPLLLAEEP